MLGIILRSLALRTRIDPEKCKGPRNLYSSDDLILISYMAGSITNDIFNIRDSKVNGIISKTRNSFTKIDN